MPPPPDAPPAPPAPDAPPDAPAGATRKVIHKDVPDEAPITPDGIALFRLGRGCTHHCPMCTSESGPDAPNLPTEDLLRRVAFLAASGFRRVALTGGEPTAHPGFWEVVAAVRGRGLAWDLHTNGRRFTLPGLAERAVDEGLVRALVSFHSDEEEAADVIAGGRRRTAAQTTDGIRRLRAAGASVMLNCVLTTFVAHRLDAFLDACAERFGPDLDVKFAFPSLDSRGLGWEPVRLRFADVREGLRALPERARRLGIRLHYESLPNCVLGDVDATPTGRPGYGESHYLDDGTGTKLLSIRRLDATNYVFRPDCPTCVAFERCPGVSRIYAGENGLDELEPFRRPDLPWWI